MSPRHLFYLGTIAVLLFDSTVSASDPTAHYAKRLQAAGVELTTASVEQYLRSLNPSDSVRKQVDLLIAQLDAETFRERQVATSKLKATPVLPLETLKRAAHSGNPEIRWRTQHVLDEYRRKQSARAETLYAVFKTIEFGGVEVSVADLIESIPHCTQRYLASAAAAAAEKIATAEDEVLLREYLESSVPSIRAAACSTLASVLRSAGKNADASIVALLEDRDELVRLFAARALADEGDRRSLGVLVNLLDAESLDVRTMAISALRGLTSQHFAYAVYDNDERRADAVAKWQQWIEANGSTAELSYPVKRGEQQWGRIIACLMNTQRVVEFDASGKQTWSKEGINGPYACIGTPDGERIITTYRDRAITAFDASGEQIWKKDGLAGAPMCLARTPSGSVITGFSLIVDRKAGGRVVEIDRAGKTLRQIDVGGAPMDLDHLPNGNLLVTIYARREVIEYDALGKEVWKLSDLKHPRSARRLPNGNTLVSMYSERRIVEYDRDKQEVWSTMVADYPMRSIPMYNGNILVAHNKGLTEINRDGEVIWSKQLGNVTGIASY